MFKVCTETIYHNFAIILGESLRRNARCALIVSSVRCERRRVSRRLVGETPRERDDALAAKLTDVSVAFAVSVVTVEAARAVAHPTHTTAAETVKATLVLTLLRELMDIKCILKRKTLVYLSVIRGLSVSAVADPRGEGNGSYPKTHDNFTDCILVTCTCTSNFYGLVCLFVFMWAYVCLFVFYVLNVVIFMYACSRRLRRLTTF